MSTLRKRVAFAGLLAAGTMLGACLSAPCAVPSSEDYAFLDGRYRAGTSTRSLPLRIGAFEVDEDIFVDVDTVSETVTLTFTDADTDRLVEMRYDIVETRVPER